MPTASTNFSADRRWTNWSKYPPFSTPFRSAITEPPLDPEEEKATLTISGFTSRPEIQRTNRNGIYIFVNKRLVRDR